MAQNVRTSQVHPVHLAVLDIRLGLWRFLRCGEAAHVGVGEFP